MSNQKKILIVEDEATLRHALRDELKREKFIVLEAVNGENGLALAKEEHPDLILTDIVMPKMDGLTMLEELRKDKWGKQAKIIILTVLNEDKKVIDALDKGVYDYLIKADWKMEEVIKKIKAKLNN
jgi:DNA-binding response OmpR family regulator